MKRQYDVFDATDKLYARVREGDNLLSDAQLWPGFTIRPVLSREELDHVESYKFDPNANSIANTKGSPTLVACSFRSAGNRFSLGRVQVSLATNEVQWWTGDPADGESLYMVTPSQIFACVPEFAIVSKDQADSIIAGRRANVVIDIREVPYFPDCTVFEQ